MDKALDGLWIIDAQAKTVYASDHMAEILGTDPSTMKGAQSFEYVFPEDTAAAKRLFDFKKSGNRAPFRFRLRRKDGSAIWVDPRDADVQPGRVSKLESKVDKLQWYAAIAVGAGMFGSFLLNWAWKLGSTYFR